MKKTTMAKTNNSTSSVKTSSSSTTTVAKRYEKRTSHHQSASTETVDYYQTVGIKKEQIYRMLDKFYYILSNPVSNESFTNASSLYKELSKYLDLKEYKSLGEAWRNLYTEENELGFANLKEAVGKVKVRFA